MTSRQVGSTDAHEAPGRSNAVGDTGSAFSQRGCLGIAGCPTGLSPFNVIMSVRPVRMHAMSKVLMVQEASRQLWAAVNCAHMLRHLSCLLQAAARI